MYLEVSDLMFFINCIKKIPPQVLTFTPMYRSRTRSTGLKHNITFTKKTASLILIIYGLWDSINMDFINFHHQEPFKTVLLESLHYKFQFY